MDNPHCGICDGMDNVFLHYGGLGEFYICDECRNDLQPRPEDLYQPPIREAEHTPLTEKFQGFLGALGIHKIDKYEKLEEELAWEEDELYLKDLQKAVKRRISKNNQ